MLQVSAPGRLRRALAGLAVALLAPAVASAAFINYTVVPSESSLSASAFGNVQVDVEPDPLDEFPDHAQMTGSTTTQPSFSSRAVVDVGLPGSFNDGANGIAFNDLRIVYNETLRIASLGGVSVPLGGGVTQLFAFNTSLSSLSIRLDDPFSTSLTPGLNPNEYLWSQTANGRNPFPIAVM